MRREGKLVLCVFSYSKGIRKYLIPLKRKWSAEIGPLSVTSESVTLQYTAVTQDGKCWVAWAPWTARRRYEYIDCKFWRFSGRRIFLPFWLVFFDFLIATETFCFHPTHTVDLCIHLYKGRNKRKQTSDLADTVKDTSASGNFSVSAFGKNTCNTWNNPKYISLILQDQVTFAF